MNPGAVNKLVQDWDLEDPETGDKFRIAWMAGEAAAFVLTGSEGFHLRPRHCREAAQRLMAHADLRDPGNKVELPQVRSDISRADIEYVVRRWIEHGGNHEALIDDLWTLASGDDPAVYTVRESQIDAVKVTHEGGSHYSTEAASSTSIGVTPLECRETAQLHQESMAHCEAIARAMAKDEARTALKIDFDDLDVDRYPVVDYHIGEEHDQVVRTPAKRNIVMGWW